MINSWYTNFNDKYDLLLLRPFFHLKAIKEETIVLLVCVWGGGGGRGYNHKPFLL